MFKRRNLRTVWRAAIALAIASAAFAVPVQASEQVILSGRVQMEDGTPLPGVHVSLFDESHGSGTLTDQDGTFGIPRQSGTYRLAVEAWDSTTPGLPDRYSLSDESFELTSDRVVTLTVPTSLVGVRVVTPEGAPLAGATIGEFGAQMVEGAPPLFVGGGPTRGWASFDENGYVTDANGRVELPLISAPGEVALVVSPPDGSELAQHAVRISPLTDGSVETVAPYPVHYSGTLTTSSGEVVVGANVVLTNVISAYATTGPDGMFDIAIAPGTYDLSISTLGHRLHFNIGYAGIEVSTDVQRDLVVPVEASSVTVLSPDGNPVPGASVSVWQATEDVRPVPPLYPGGPEGSASGFAGWGTANETGVARIDLVAVASEFRIYASPPDGTDWVYGTDRTGLLGPGFTHTVSVRPGHVVTGTLSSPEFGAVAGHVTLSSPDGTFGSTTDDAGVFDFRAAPGAYKLWINSNHEDEEDHFFSVRYEPGLELASEQVLDLTVPLRSKTVRVLDELGRPVQGAQVNLWAELEGLEPVVRGGGEGEGHSWSSAVTDAGGVTTLKTLVGAGRGHLTVVPPPGSPLQIDARDVLPSGDDVVVYLDDPATHDRYISSRRSVEFNEHSWHNSDVTLEFECYDRWSPVVECPGPVTFTKEGVHHHTATSVNERGDREYVTDWVRIDKTAPQISAAAVGQTNAAGWHRTPVNVTFACTDSLSGIDECAEPVEVAAEGRSVEVTGLAVDRAGNQSATALALNIDRTAPETTVSAGPAARTVTGTVSDSTSGPEGVTVTLRSVVTGAVSSRTATVNCAANGACTWSLTPTGLAPGAYVVSAAGADVAGNVDATPATKTLLIL